VFFRRLAGSSFKVSVWPSVPVVRLIFGLGSFMHSEKYRELLIQCSTLRPINSVAWLHCLWVAFIYGFGLWLASLNRGFLADFSAIILLAVGGLQSFIVMHECGHGTMFSSPWLNRWILHIAGFFAMVPGVAWKTVHHQHHLWTGWKDRDPTTSLVLPGNLPSSKTSLINFAWKFHIPIFNLMYRLGNFWNLARLVRLYPNQRLALGCNILSYFAVYSFLFLRSDSRQLAIAICVVYLHLYLSEPIMLSQHTHIPQRLAAGQKVRRFVPWEQEVFTRSVSVPRWVAKMVLFNFNAHELHHIFPKIPGYMLHRIKCKTENSVSLLEWMRTSRALNGSDLLFKSREATGIWI
jgi:fatty acid desaturase